MKFNSLILFNFIILLFSCFNLNSYAASDVYLVPKSTQEIIYYPETFKTSDGLILHGHLAIPAGKKVPADGFAVVMMLVGSGQINRYENFPKTVTENRQPTLFFQEIEKALVKKGIAVFLYDKRGVVPINDAFFTNKITNQYQTANANNLANDALTAFDFLSHLKQTDGTKLIDNTKIIILGHSEGTSLALKIAEQRPGVKSLFLLGVMSRPMKDTLQYQLINNKLRNFNLYDTNQDGVLTKKEYEDFINLANKYDKDFPKQASSSFLDINPRWKVFYKAYTQLNRLNEISMQEFNFGNEQTFKKLMESINDNFKPWTLKEPRDWFAQYFQEGAYLKRELPFCKKMHIFQGEIDPQTLFEDALEVRNACQARHTPLASFKSYPHLTHGFSHYTGYKKWRYTLGPPDPNVVNDIVDEAVKDFK